MEISLIILVTKKVKAMKKIKTITIELAPMTAISGQVENLSTSPSDHNRDCLAECDEDFIAETLSFKEEGGVESPHLKDGKFQC